MIDDQIQHIHNNANPIQFNPNYTLVIMSRQNRNQARFTQWLELDGSLGPCSAINNINYNPKPHFSNKSICGKAHNLSS